LFKTCARNFLNHFSAKKMAEYNDDCGNVVPCSHPRHQCLLCEQFQPCSIHEHTYEVSSCATQDSGFNHLVDGCDKGLHPRNHEHFIQYESSQHRYIIQGSLYLVDNCSEFFIRDEFCGFCETMIDDEDEFTFNLKCMCCYHKSCLKALLLKGYTNECVVCEDVKICKACIRCTY
jgi:hypothetical protein